MHRSKLILIVSLWALIAPACSDNPTTETVVSENDVVEVAEPACIEALCDDGNPCTQGKCDPITDTCFFPAVEGTKSCDDNNACTEDDQCDANGACVGGASIQCEDGDPCTDDNCDIATGCKFTTAPEGFPCSDGDACTTGDGCLNGECTGTPVYCEDDNEPCTIELGCSGDKGECLTEVMEEGTPCSDGNACTTESACTEGLCGGGIPVTCNDDNPCTDDGCSPKSGCSYVPNGDPCNDNSVCTTNDACAQGQCKSEPVVCDDGNPCTSENCDPDVGCLFQPVTLPCEDGNPCTINDICSDGQCNSGDQKGCDDGNPCTQDSCSLETGECNFTVTSDTCDDGSACTLDDTCNEGDCVGLVVDCDDGNPCTGAGCDPIAGCLFGVVADACDDGDLCTTGDTCENGECVSQGVFDCSDGNPCDEEYCEAENGCKSTPVEGDCEDGNPCTTGDTCAAGFCSSGTLVPCDDDNPCTDDSCDPEQGCVHLPQPGACNDENPCTTGDTCDETGNCAGGTDDCNDGNPCTADTCNTDTGCVYENVEGPCDDGEECFSGDTCGDGECLAGDIPACDDNNVCTLDECDENLQCAYTNVENVCDDGDACTTSGICEAGACSSTTVNCNDGNPCTTDLCNPQDGCIFVTFAGDCDDGNLCTINTTCDEDNCTGGNTVSCDDGNPCTDEICEPDSGCQFSPINTGDCDDGNVCTEGTTCIEGTCMGGNSVCQCETDDDCTALNDDNVCNGSLACNKENFPFVCAVVPETVVNCPNDDPTGCTEPVCITATGECEVEIVEPGGQGCSDGDACTEGEYCVGSDCKWGEPVTCNDDNLCTLDSCDSATGCVFEPNTLPCDDGDTCTANDLCISGSCMGEPCSVQGLECVAGACIDTCYGTKFTCPGQSCLDILEAEDGPLESGLYWIDPEGSTTEVPFQVFCDMVTNGGGWTAITPTIADVHFDSKVSTIEFITNYGKDAEGRPYCEDGEGGHSCRYTFNVPFGFSDFYLLDYTAKPTTASTPVDFDAYEYMLSSWVKANDGTLGYTGKDGYGDIGLGPYPSDAPVIRFSEWFLEGFSCSDCEIDWPGGTSIIFGDATIHSSFGICWGEAGAPIEGIYPWWGGSIMLR